jgi:hypothetical protein
MRSEQSQLANRKDDSPTKSRYTLEVITKEGLDTQNVKDMIWNKLGEMPDVDYNGKH